MAISGFVPAAMRIEIASLRARNDRSGLALVFQGGGSSIWICILGVIWTVELEM
jgi:hypothetical protein